MFNDFKDKPSGISTRLDTVMKLRNIHTFTDIAKELNVSPRSVGSWYYGDSMPNFINLIKLACLFDTSIEYLLSITSEIEPESIPKSYTSKVEYVLDDLNYSDETVRHNHLWCYSCNDILKPILIVSRDKVRAKLFLEIKK